MSELKIDSNGVLKLPQALRRQLGSAALAPISCSPGHLLLGRSDDDSSPVLLAGTLGEIAVPDLLSFFNMFRKTGVLHFELDGGSKALYFQQGEIVYATSTFARDDLGEILFALGKVEREALQQVRPLVRARSTLGRLLVERGLLTPKDLWLAARNQVEGIVYNLFTFFAGGFYFQARPLDQEQILRLSMSTQNLIMEGLRRLDEKALFMRKIISLDYYPVPTGRELPELGQTEARLFGAVQGGQQSARDLFRRTGHGEFAGMRLLYGLLEKGVLRMEDEPAAEMVGEMAQILSLYNALLKVIYAPMKKASPQFDQEIAGYLRELPQPFSFVLRDVELLPDGSLDGHRIVANLTGLEEGDKQRLLADSLSELVFMETMAVRRELSAEAGRPLIARVQEVTARVRDLIGKDGVS